MFVGKISPLNVLVMSIILKSKIPVFRTYEITY